MAADKDRDSLIQLALGPLVALLIFGLSFTKALERAELLSYDWRLNVRNNLFGPPPMDPRLGTIDIDDKSIESEGRYQDWTRDKYKDVVSILSRFGASALAFDVYFTEPSARVIAENQIAQWSTIDSTSLAALAIVRVAAVPLIALEAVREDIGVNVAVRLPVGGVAAHGAARQVGALCARCALQQLVE